MALLDRVNQPADLLRLSPAELDTLAGEIRQTILRTVHHSNIPSFHAQRVR